MVKPVFTFLFVCCCLLSCTTTTTSPSGKLEYFNLPGFFRSEIARLQKDKPHLMKTIQTGDVVQSFESDTVNWQKELSVFLTLNLNRAGREAEYLVTTDSSGSLSITRYTARDSNLVLRDVAITRRDGKTELLVLETVSRSWVRDRTVRFSYQPGKGYGIHQTENTLWGSPQTMEIFAEIQDEAHLKK